MRISARWIVTGLFWYSTCVWAQVAAYDLNTGILSIPSVKVGGATYTGVTLQNIGPGYTFALRTANLQQPPGQAVATYRIGSSTLLLPSVSVGSTSYSVTMQNIGDYNFQLTRAAYTLPHSYATQQAYVNFVSTPLAFNFAVTGTYQGYDLAGSYGTVTLGSLSPATFEGKSALAGTTALSFYFISSGTSLGSNSTTQINYVDANYQPLGRAKSGSGNTNYEVTAGPPTIPQAAQVGDSGTLFTSTVYSGSDKTTVTGTNKVTFAVQPDSNSTTTAILVLTETLTSPTGSTIQTITITYRLTPSGILTWLSETVVQGADSFVLTPN